MNEQIVEDHLAIWVTRCAKAQMLADRLDGISEGCAERAPRASTPELEMDLLTRAYTYQECAGLIREALK